MFFREIIMLHKNILDPAHTTLAVIDMQEGFRAAISDFAETAARIALVAHSAQLLQVPVIVTEKYPRGLGHTASEIKAVLPAGFKAIEKTAFSSCGANAFEAELERRLISEALRKHRGNISRAARELGLTRRGLYLKLERYSLKATGT